MKKNLITPILLVLITHFCAFAQKPKSKAPAETVPKRMKLYDMIRGFDDPNLCAVGNDYRLGFIDKNGKEVIPCVYQTRNFIPNKNGHIPVFKPESGAWGVIDTKDNVIIPFKYANIECVGEYFAVYPSGRSSILINSKQETILKGDYEQIKYLGNNLYAVFQNRKWLVVNTKEEVLKELNYAYVLSNVGHGLTVVVDKNEKYGLIDSLGKEIVPLKYSEILSFSGGLARVRITDIRTKDRLFGFIDPTGKEIIKAKYENLGSKFGEGLVPVNVGNNGTYSWGYMDRNEKMVIDPWFSTAEIFSDGFARVSTDRNRVGYIDKQGKFSGMYQEARTYQNGLAEVTINGKKAFIDTKKRVVIETDPNATKLLEEQAIPVEEAPRQLEQSIAPDKPSKAVEVGLDKPQEEIFQTIEQPPFFIGGSVAFQEYTAKNLKYPEAAKKADVMGVVYVEIGVTLYGILDTAKVVKSLGYGCDEEALRFIKSIIKWQPAKVNARDSYGKTTIPILFQSKIPF